MDTTETNYENKSKPSTGKNVSNKFINEQDDDDDDLALEMK